MNILPWAYFDGCFKFFVSVSRANSLLFFQNKCPDEQLPPLKPLPDLSPGYKDLLNRWDQFLVQNKSDTWWPISATYFSYSYRVCHDVMQSRIPSSREISGRENLMKDLIQFVRQSYPTGKSNFSLKISPLDGDGI